MVYVAAHVEAEKREKAGTKSNAHTHGRWAGVWGSSARTSAPAWPVAVHSMACVTDDGSNGFHIGPTDLHVCV